MSTSLVATTPPPPHAAAAGEPTAPVRAGGRLRLREAMPQDGFVGWAGPLAIAFVAGVFRFHRLDSPRAFVFDETYYAKDAWSVLKHGNEQAFAEGANERILNGDLDVFNGLPAFIAHPPVGKWVIALGEMQFGLTPFGWRFMVAVLGTLSVLMLARIGRRLFRSTLLGCTAALLLALDGLHFVQSRTALLDIILMFFILAAFGCLLLDRDRARARLEWHGAVVPPAPGEPPSWPARVGASSGWRPWRLAAGIFLGLAAGTKWSGLPFIAVFGVLTVAWDYGARRAAGALNPLTGMLVRDAPKAFLAVVGGAAAAYLAGWAGWFATSTGYNRQQAADTSSSPTMAALKSFWDYHKQMWNFNTGLSEPHTYESNPWTWMLLGRPVSYFYESPKQGDLGCEVESCSQAILALGTPALWWAGVAAVLAVVYFALLNRDWRAAAILAGLVGGYLPWFRFQERTVYSFYAVVFAPFMVLAVTYVLGLLWGSPRTPPSRLWWGRTAAVAVVVLVALNFWYLYPILSGQTIPYAEWHDRMWLESWI